MKKLILLALTALSLVGSLEARLGETPDECAKRYGATTEKTLDGRWIAYVKNGVRIQCGFKDGKCHYVQYELLSESSVIYADLGKEKRFDQEQAMRLLSLNCKDSKWKLIKKNEYGEDWDGIYETEDGKLHALVSSAAVNVEDKIRAAQEIHTKDKVDQVISEFEK